MTSTEPRRRGVALTIALSLLTAVQALVIVVGLGVVVEATDHGQTVGVPFMLLLFLAVVALVAYAGVWAWQRWAVVLIGITAVLGLITDLIGGVQPLLLLVRVGLLVWFAFMIADRWESFR